MDVQTKTKADRLHMATLRIAALIVLSVQTVRAGHVIEVSAGKHDRVATPVSVELPASFAGQRQITLKQLETGDSVPAQVNGKKPRRLVWLLRDPLAAGETRRYSVSRTETTDSTKRAATVEDDGKHLTITVGGKPVLVYNVAVVPSPNRNEAYYDRSGYIHPLYNPRGQIVTDDFAPDHPHQHGIMFPWTNTTFEGRAVNFWDQKSGKGKVEHTSIESQTSGPVFAEFTVGLKHLDLTTLDKPAPVLIENWRVRVYNLTEYFLFDLVSTQQSDVSPLNINQYHYGGLAIRGHRNWLNSGQGDFLTNEGKSRKDGNHTRPRWCDMHGLIDGQTTGVTILGDPRNFRAPQPVRLHPQKPYFCFAPMVLGKFKIEADKPYVSRYRFYVHNGKLDPQTAQRLWNDVADPPAARIVEE